MFLNDIRHPLDAKRLFLLHRHMTLEDVTVLVANGYRGFLINRNSRNVLEFLSGLEGWSTRPPGPEAPYSD